MPLINQGRTAIRTELQSLFTKGGIGLEDVDFSRSDTGLTGDGTTIDDCDAVTGWSSTGVGSSVVLNTTAGEFQEGTGCLNLPTSGSGTAIFTKTITNIDLSNDFIALWFYIDNASDLTTSSTGLTIKLEDSGADTASYDFNTSNFSNGWTGIQLEVSSPDSEDAGFNNTDVVKIILEVDVDSAITGNSMRMDYWRYYESGTLGITDSQNTLNYETGDYYIKTIHIISASESNGLALNESGLSDGSTLYTRSVFATVDKGESTELQIDDYFYIDPQ